MGSSLRVNPTKVLYRAVPFPSKVGTVESNLSPYNSRMRIVVTGGGGFIGGHLVERLSKMEAGEIIVFDNFHRPCIDASTENLEGVRLFQGDVRDRNALTEVMRGCPVVFHLAAQSNVMGAVYDADYAFSSNVTGTFNVLRAAIAAGVKRVVFTSSREVYGDPRHLPVRESSPLRPKNGYGASKAAGEVYCRSAANEGLETVILRFANVYGARDRDRVIPLFARAAASGAPLTIYGGEQVLDFVWVETVVVALMRAGFGHWIRGPVNVGSGMGVTIRQLAERIVDLTRSPSPIHNLGAREQEVSRFVADISHARKVLGIKVPQDPLEHLPEVLSSLSHPLAQSAIVGRQFRPAV
jgi:UDP-glucose 4-epimerase